MWGTAALKKATLLHGPWVQHPDVEPMVRGPPSVGRRGNRGPPFQPPVVAARAPALGGKVFFGNLPWHTRFVSFAEKYKAGDFSKMSAFNPWNFLPVGLSF